MLEQHIKNLEVIINDINDYNTHFCNHVGQHKEEYFRRGILILQAVVILTLMIFV